MFVLDTNIFLRVFTGDSPAQFSDCQKLIEAIEDKEVSCLIPGVVLQEIAWTLKSFYKVEKQDVTTILERIISLGAVKIVDSYDYALTIDLFKAKNVKFVDCLIASLESVQKKNFTIISYDKDFDKLGVKRCEPRDIVLNF